MHTPSRRSIYTNPSARSWTSSGLGDLSAAARFHRSLPGFQSTKLVSLDAVAKEIGVKSVFVKDESNRLGLPSFKILGASWGVYRAIAAKLDLPLTIDIPALAIAAQKGSVELFAATDGNHGRAVARMAQILGIQAQIFVPQGLHEATMRLIIDEGAQLTVVTGGYDESICRAAEEAKVRGGLMVQDTSFEGYDEVKWIIEGYGTMMQEIDDQLSGEQPDVVVVPVGVGSLAQAVVSYSKASGRNSAILTVEPDTAGCLRQSLEKGTSTSVTPRSTIMAGLNCETVSPIAWPILQAGVDASVTISDAESHEAVQYLHSMGIAAGPCGAAPLAALRFVARSDPTSIGLTPDSVVVLLCTEGTREYAPPKDVSGDDPVALTQTLVRIDSSNPGLSSAAGAGETEIAEYIVSWLEHRDIEVNWVEDVPGRPSVVGVARGTGGGKSLMFNGHIDTVTTAGYDGDPLSGDLFDGAIHGRGAIDMKAGVAASLIAIARAKVAKLRGDVIIAAVADEENTSIGTEQVLKAGWRADGALVSEPTSLEAFVAHKGFVWLDIDIVGSAAHGSRPDLGVDAIAKAGHFLVALERYGQELMDGPRHPLIGTGTVHAGLIKGGEEPSSYPARCIITVERRTVPGETPALVEAQLTNILDIIAKSVPDFSYAIRVTFSRLPFEISTSDPFIATVLRHIESTLGCPPTIGSMTAWTDCALLAEKGIPTILFGVDGEGLHAKQEWATVDSLHKVTETLTSVGLEFCQ